MTGKFKPGDTVYDRGGSRRGRIIRMIGPNKYQVKFGGQEGVFSTGQLYSEAEFRAKGGRG